MSRSNTSPGVVEVEKSEFQNPLVIGGFVEAGLVGVATVSYIIERLQLHQIAYVESEHIPPVAVFIGERLRRAFRIYANANRELVMVVSEVPIDFQGLHKVSTSLLDWCEQIRAREIVVIDGIPVRGLPEQRESYFVAEEKRCMELKTKGFKLAPQALIGGISGAILNGGIGRKISVLSILTPTSLDIPDPGAVLLSVKALNALYQLNTDTSDLEKNVDQLNKYLSTLLEEHQKLEERKQMKPKQIYG